MSTVSWSEVLWLGSTGLGLLVSFYVLHQSMVSRAVLYVSGINSTRRYMATTEVLRNTLRAAVQGIFVAVGVWFATQSDPSRFSLSRLIINIAFVSASVLLTLASMVDLVRFRHVILLSRGEQDQE